MIVVDTDLICYLYLTGEYSAPAERALRRDPEWAAPLLWRSEMRSVLAFYLHWDWLSLQDAEQIMDAATALMQGREYETTSLQVLSLVAASTCSAYDCAFVALALYLDVPLVTTDQRIVDQFPTLAISLNAFVGAQAG